MAVAVTVSVAALRIFGLGSIAASAPFAAAASMPLTIALLFPVGAGSCGRRDFFVFRGISSAFALVAAPAAGFVRGVVERRPPLHFLEHAFAVASFALERDGVHCSGVGRRR